MSMLRRISSALATFDALPPPPSNSLVAASKGAFDPHSVFISRWHQLLLCALSYELFIVPFLFTFKPDASLVQTPEAIVFYTCEALFLLDFYVKLHTTSILDGNTKSLGFSRRAYLHSTEFALDAVAILPLSLFPITLPGSRMLLELTKVVRVTRLPKYLGNLDNLYAKHFGPLKLFKILISIMLLSHGIACARFSFGYHSASSDPLHQDHWLPVHSGHDRSVLTRYLRSVFWAFGMLMGLFEGELPRNSAQFVFTIFVAVCGFAMFTYLCATFFMLSKCESSQSEASDARINQFKQVMQFHDVPTALQLKVVDYLRYYYEDAGSSDRQVTEMLCQSIARDIQVELVKDVLAHVPLFASCSEQFLVAITRLLERISLPAHNTVFEVGDSGDAMYIIHTGVLDVVSRSGRKLRELRKNSFVGELSLFSDLPRSATVITATFCVLYKLSRRHAAMVLKGYPGVAGSIRLLVKQALEAAAPIKQTGDSEAAAPQVTSMPRRSTLFGSSMQQLMRRSSSVRGSLFRKNGSASSVVPIPPNRHGGAAQSIQDELLWRPDRASGTESAGMRRKGSDAMRAFYLDYLRSAHMSAKRPWWAKLLLNTCIDADSPHRIWWIACLQVVLVYNWSQIPFNLAFPLFARSAWYMVVLNFVSDVVLWVDMYVNFNLSFTHNSETIWEPMRSAPRYLRGHFGFDMLTAIPFSGFSDTTFTYIGRIPRLFRIWRSIGHYREITQLQPLKSKQRLLLYGVLLGLLSHIFACLYFSVTLINGFSSAVDSWLPSHDVELRSVATNRYMDYQGVTYDKDDPEVRRIAYMQYFRALYYATNVLTALGKTVEPDTDVELAVALVFMFSGFFITAIVVDNVQKRFTASAFEEREFFATRSRIQLFLRHQNAPFAIHQRANNYLEYWWESHRGAKISQLLSDLPTEYRREVLMQICKPALQTLALLRGIRPLLDAMEVALVDNSEFILYGHGETIFGEGEHALGLFFLLEGRVSLLSASEPLREVIRGSCFGTRSLCAEGESTGYSETALAESGCTVLFLPRQRLAKLQTIFPTIDSALSDLERRLYDSKLSSKRINQGAERLHGATDDRCGHWFGSVIDPDSTYVIVWETWLFFLMSFQWFRVLVLICFGIEPSDYAREDSLMVAAEVCFLLDIVLRTRLGYVHFGNKVMDRKLIRRRYLRSWHLAVDVVAILPLYVIHWTSPSLRMELVNINKLVRLVKVPSQLRALEKRYVKYANELRLFKLVYYTSVASHLLGSLYFDFASHASAIYSLTSGEERATNFGGNKWLPPLSLKYATKAEQYFASQFWSFGLMSASTQAELPKTSVQCIFTIATLTTGFFLFAYVVGNMADVIELGDAENREINEKVRWTRRLLHHFSLSHPVASRLKTYFLFKRFHSITQEHTLAQSLPPSLMTDIRLLNLRAMIEKVPFLGGMEGAITRMLVSQFTQCLVLKGEHVFRVGDAGTDMYFVFLGGLQVLVPHTYMQLSRKKPSSKSARAADEASSLAVLGELGTGDFFGENALLSDAPRSVGVRAKTSCILYSLSKHALEDVFELYPAWRKRVEQMAKLQQKQQRLAPSVSDQARKKPVPLVSASGGAIAPKRDAAASLPRSRWRRLLRLARNGVELQSAEYIVWVRLLVAATLSTALFVPYCIAFESCGRWDRQYAAVDALEVCCFVVFCMDVWVQWRLQQSEQSAEICEGNAHDAYKRHRLVWDVLALLPLEYVALAATGASSSGWLRFNRCFKVVNLGHYMDEAGRTSVSFESAQLKKVCAGYVLVIHWVACLYLLFAEHTGYGVDWNAWMPSREVDLTHTSASVLGLRYLRGLFFAVTAFVKKCRTFTPETISANIFAILTWFSGLLVMAFVIGEIARLYISFIGHEVVFRKHFIATERSLAEWKLSAPLKARVHAFLANLWSSHRGLHYQAVLDELPSNLRHETMVEIGGAALSAFESRFLQPLTLSNTSSLPMLVRALVEKLRFESYPAGEFVVTEGTIPYGVFFVVKGQLAGSVRRGHSAQSVSSIKQGSYFGALGLLSCSMSKLSVQTSEASDLLSLSLDDLQSFLQSLPAYSRVECTLQQLLDDLRAEHNGALPAARAAWSRKLLGILRAQRMALALRFSSASGHAEAEDEWGAYLTSLLDTEEPGEASLHALVPFLELMLPPGELMWDETHDGPAAKHGDDARSKRSAFSKQRVLSVSRHMRGLGRSTRRMRDHTTAPSLTARIHHVKRRGVAKVAAQPVPVQTPVEAFTLADQQQGH